MSAKVVTLLVVLLMGQTAHAALVKKGKKPKPTKVEAAAPTPVHDDPPAPSEAPIPPAPPPPKYDPFPSKPPPVATPPAETAVPVKTTTALSVGDATVKGAMIALTEAIVKDFAAKHGDQPFHRIAIASFSENGPNAKQEQAGRLLSEVLSVELQGKQKFVIVERERLDQVMKEHRLADLGVIDEASAAAFGKILGAQSLVLGSVNEAGPSYVVAVRMVDAETGEVALASQVEVARTGLIALSSEAIETRSRGGAILRSVIVPGWGQIYNQEPIKGAIFAIAAGATLAVAGTFLGLGVVAMNQYNLNTLETVGQRQIANDRFLIANISLAAFGVAWAIAVVDAAINGKDYSRVDVKSALQTGALSF